MLLIEALVWTYSMKFILTRITSSTSLRINDIHSTFQRVSPLISRYLLISGPLKPRSIVIRSFVESVSSASLKLLSEVKRVGGISIKDLTDKIWHRSLRALYLLFVRWHPPKIALVFDFFSSIRSVNRALRALRVATLLSYWRQDDDACLPWLSSLWLKYVPVMT